MTDPTPPPPVAQSEAPVVRAVVTRLVAAGYAPLRTPFRVATVEFAFTAALTGGEGRQLDLVLIVDTTTGEHGDRDAERVRQRVEALSRALDITGSRYVVTVILAGAVLAGDIEALSETCRVLSVEGIALDPDGRAATPAAVAQLDDRIRILLPLTIPGEAPIAGDGARGAAEALCAALSGTVEPTLLDRLIAASGKGERGVTDALGKALEAELILKEAR